MEFFTSFPGNRPVRLSSATRHFAKESLDGVYGRDTLKNYALPVSGEGSPLDRYDRAVTVIASQAPVRLCPGEKLSGAATLGKAIHHHVPVDFSVGGDIYSVSHLTVDFSEVLAVGYEGIMARAEECRRKNPDQSTARFYQSVMTCLEAFRIYHQRYLAALKDLPEYEKNYKRLLHVPARGAESFAEALQSLWFTFSFLRLCGNWPGIGRLDVLLGDFLKRDLASGAITLSEARELTAHFFIKGCEWVNGTVIGSGDAQHYQNIVLSGLDEEGRDVTNEVTYLVLDVVEELPIGDFPIAVRVSPNTDPVLLKKIAEVVRLGGGVVAVYNENLIMDAMTGYGYSLSDARRFANDGCWEVQVPGETYFMYSPFDGLQILQHQTLKDYACEDFPSWEALYQAYVRDLSQTVEKIERDHLAAEWDAENGVFRPGRPCTAVSVFEKDCIARGRSYFEGGTRFTVFSPHIGGLADIVNSLYAIKKLVFDDRLTTQKELFSALRNNWEGYEVLRQTARTRWRYFGNDNAEVTEIYRRLLHDFARACACCDGLSPIRFPAGVSTFGRQIEWAPYRLATPCGNKAGDVLAGNASPTPGTDREGVTSIIRACAGADLREAVTGAALEVTLPVTSLTGEEGLEGLVSLIRGFVAVGGFFLQPDTADASLLREAQKHPEQYQTLSVRVSGWNARFATLDKQWQDMVIARTEGNT